MRALAGDSTITSLPTFLPLRFLPLVALAFLLRFGFSTFSVLEHWRVLLFRPCGTAWYAHTAHWPRVPGVPVLV